MKMEYQSEQIGELASALAKAQGEMEAALKSATNPFFGSKFADLNSIIGASREPLSKNGLCIIQSVIKNTTEANSNGMALMTQITHSSGQWIRSVMPIILTKTDHQSVGSALSYYRRYSYSSLVGVTQEDDDGEKAMDRKKKQEEEINEFLITTQQAKSLIDMISEDRLEGFRNYLTTIGYKDEYEIKVKDYDRLMKMVNKSVKS